MPGILRGLQSEKNCDDEDTVCPAPEIRKDRKTMAAWWLRLEAGA